MKRLQFLLPLVTAFFVCAVVVAQNNGAKPKPRELKWRIQQLHKDNNEGVAVGDINGDDKKDVVAGEYWYAAPDFQPKKLRRLVPFGNDYLQNNSDHLLDVDGDGDLDVVAGGFTLSEIFWYENPGEGGYDAEDGWAAQKLADTHTTQNEITFLRDLDGDGVPEWLQNSWNDNVPMVVWRFEKDKEGKPVLKGHVIGEGKNGHGMGFGDINGDGLEDIIFKQGWYERPKDGPFSGPWKHHDDFTLQDASCPLLVLDLDQDGRNDIIWADGHNYGLYWEKQQEPQSDGSTTWRTYEIDKKFSQGHALAWSDVDNDGVGELITGKRYYGHSGKDPGAEDPVTIQYYDWDRETLSWKKHLISTGEPGEAPGIGLQIRVTDLDSNGWKDIVVPGKSGTHILWNDGFPDAIVGEE